MGPADPVLVNLPNANPGPGSVDGVATSLGWWLVDGDARVVSGPFPAQVDAALARLPLVEDDLAPVYGLRMDDDTVLRRSSPDDRGWLAHLSDQLDRLAEDWDTHISDADPLTGLVCEVAAALVETGLPLHDCTGRTPSRGQGGVCLTPNPARGGVIVSWAQHDRMSVHLVRGPDAEQAVQQTMCRAVADVLGGLGFTVESIPGTTAALVYGEGRSSLWD